MNPDPHSNPPPDRGTARVHPGSNPARVMSGAYGPYRVIKAGLNGLTEYFHGEYGEAGLIASSTGPGWVPTDLGSSESLKSPAEGANTPV